MNQSPLPQALVQSKMDFPAAIREVINGKRITRGEWANEQVYGFLNGDILSLYKEDGKNYQWIVNAGDLMANDWLIIYPAGKE